MKFTFSPALSAVDQYLPLAQTADECGFAHASLPDAVFYPEKVETDYPYTSDGKRFWQADTPWLEPWVAIPAMAAVTKRLRFVTSVLKLGIRNPLLVARTVQSAAVLSNNRVVLGVGLGWIPDEFKWCGTEYKTRGKRVNESIEIIQKVLAGGMVEYHGEHYDFDRLQIAPAPSKPVPIYVGGHSKPALRRAAKYADGWTSAMLTTKEIPPIIEQLNEFRKQFGTDQKPFEIQVTCTDAFNIDGFKKLEEIGVTDCILQPWLFYGVAVTGTTEEKQDGLKKFADQVIQKM